MHFENTKMNGEYCGTVLQTDDLVDFIRDMLS